MYYFILKSYSTFLVYFEEYFMPTIDFFKIYVYAVIQGAFILHM